MSETVRIRPESFRALDPTAGPLAAAADARESAGRKASLDGAVLAVVDNGFNPNFAQTVIDALSSRFRLAEVIHVVKDNVSVPPRHPDWERIKAKATAGIALYGG